MARTFWRTSCSFWWMFFVSMLKFPQFYIEIFLWESIAQTLLLCYNQKNQWRYP